MTPEDLRLLFDYDAWANDRTRSACAALTPEQLTRDLGSSFRSVHDTLVHILGAQWIWLERFHGRSPAALPASAAYADFAAVRDGWAEVERELHKYVAGLSSTDIDGAIEWRNAKGDALRSRLGPILQHLANHGTYHRGQVTTLLRQLGAKPVSTDLIGFYRERERAAQAAK